MHEHDEDDRTVAALEALRSAPQPRPELEDELVTHLRGRGLLSGGSASRFRMAAVWLLPVLAAFGTGWLAGSWGPREPQGTRYMLLLYGGMDDPADTRGSVEEYAAWARQARAAGTQVQGEKLSARDPVIVGSALPAATSSGLVGYFVIAARDDRQAASLAASHPHVRRGGTIVVRRIDPT
jgi:hypothetical protein